MTVTDWGEETLKRLTASAKGQKCNVRAHRRTAVLHLTCFLLLTGSTSCPNHKCKYLSSISIHSSHLMEHPALTIILNTSSIFLSTCFHLHSPSNQRVPAAQTHPGFHASARQPEGPSKKQTRSNHPPVKKFTGRPLWLSPIASLPFRLPFPASLATLYTPVLYTVHRLFTSSSTHLFI